MGDRRVGAFHHAARMQDVTHRLEEDPAVERRALAPGILPVQPRLFRHGHAVTAAHLGQPGQARTDRGSAVAAAQAKQIGFGQHHGARPHEAHVPLEDVPQLGQFVQAELTQHAAGAGNVILRTHQLVGGHVGRVVS